MQIAGKVDYKTKRITSLVFLSHTFEDERILGSIASALCHRDTRFEIFVDGDLAISFCIGGEDDRS